MFTASTRSRLWLVALAAAALTHCPEPAFAQAGGACSVSRPAQLGTSAMYSVSVSCTGDPASGVFPAATINPVAAGALSLVESQVQPGTPAPTAGYSIAVNDQAGVDQFRGSMASLSASAVQTFVVPSPRPALSALTVAITNNGAGSAQTTVILLFAPQSNFGLAPASQVSISNMAPVEVRAFDGTRMAPLRAATAANGYAADGTALPSIGALLTEKAARWSAISNPSAGSKATASAAAGAAGVRHVADCISFSAASDSTGSAGTDLTVNLRDGATGAGTVIFTWQVGAAASGAAVIQTVAPYSVCGLNLVGTAATAMTLEFSAALAHQIQAVSISGYDIQ